jgi:DNA polymerase/3'-5' exonuclease PolX
MNNELSKIFYEISELLKIKGVSFKPRAYEKAAKSLENLKEDISLIYKNSGLKGVEEIPGVGKSIAQKIQEYLKTGKIKYYKDLKEETAIRQIVTHYFKTKGVPLDELKRNAKKKKIIYSRFTKPAKQLLELAGSVKKAEEAMDRVAGWANSRNLDYSIETVFKKWLELDRLKPKDVIKKPFYNNQPMIWSEARKRWYVIDDGGSWLEYADKEEKIEWRIVK